MIRLLFRERCLLLLPVLLLLGAGHRASAADLVVDSRVSIVVPADVDAPVKKAVTVLQADFYLMMNFRPQVVMSPSGGGLQLVVVQGDKDVKLGYYFNCLQERRR